MGQGQGGTAQVVGPVVLLAGRDRGDVPLGALGELEGDQLDHAVLLGGIGDVDAFVDGKAGDLPEVMVGVGPDRADPVRAERRAFGVAVV